MTSSTTLRPPFPAGTIENFFPKSPHFFLSNFFMFSIDYEGMTFKSNEHAYQAAKTLHLPLREEIRDLPFPVQAKRRGSRIELRSNWDFVKFSIMEDLIKRKFVLGNPMARLLLGTGDVPLIEGNYWHDMVWGQCFCPRHDWKGQNRLGGLLMARREELKSEYR